MLTQRSFFVGTLLENCADGEGGALARGAGAAASAGAWTGALPGASPISVLRHSRRSKTRTRTRASRLKRCSSVASGTRSLTKSASRSRYSTLWPLGPSLSTIWSAMEGRGPSPSQWRLLGVATYSTAGKGASLRSRGWNVASVVRYPPSSHSLLLRYGKAASPRT